MNWIDIIGYVASGLILFASMMSSIEKLRFVNLLGCILFAYYGFKIGSLPTGLMNGGIALINIYHLQKLSRKNKN